MSTLFSRNIFTITRRFYICADITWLNVGEAAVQLLCAVLSVRHDRAELTTVVACDENNLFDQLQK